MIDIMNPMKPIFLAQNLGVEMSFLGDAPFAAFFCQGESNVHDEAVLGTFCAWKDWKKWRDAGNQKKLTRSKSASDCVVSLQKIKNCGHTHCNKWYLKMRSNT